MTDFTAEKFPQPVLNNMNVQTKMQAIFETSVCNIWNFKPAFLWRLLCVSYWGTSVPRGSTCNCFRSIQTKHYACLGVLDAGDTSISRKIFLIIILLDFISFTFRYCSKLYDTWTHDP